MKRFFFMLTLGLVFSFALFTQDTAEVVEHSDLDSALFLRQHQYGDEYMQVSRSVDHLNATLKATPANFVQREYDMLMRPVHETLWKKNTTLQLSAETYYYYENDSVSPIKKEIVQIPEKKVTILFYTTKGLLEQELVFNAEQIPLQKEYQNPEVLAKKRSDTVWKYDQAGRTTEEIRTVFGADSTAKTVRKTWEYNSKGKKTLAAVYEDGFLVKKIEYLSESERREIVFFEDNFQVTSTYIDNEKKNEVFSKDAIANKTRTY